MKRCDGALSFRLFADIEKKRKELYSMKEKSTFTDRGMLGTSRELDLLIGKYYVQKKGRK
ncbi:MAG: aspartyl-phosphate phosphatase Spo0E family protein [Firmicutes bacterium]|jgi:hypothetical protein|nr:aspartyl-phosphate phosphatase Spo0E family protein [Bacillota bacterium]